MNKDEWIEDMMNDLLVENDNDYSLLDDIFEDVCEEIGVDKSDYHYYYDTEQDSIVVQLIV